MLMIGSFQSCSAFRIASPDSNNPVHWISTSGTAPPRCSPAATCHVSPSRQTRTTRIAPRRSSSACHGPIVLSGTVTTWVTPSRSSSDAISSPENILLVRLRGRRRNHQILDEELEHSRRVDPRVPLVGPELQIEALAGALQRRDELHHV